MSRKSRQQLDPWGRPIKNKKITGPKFKKSLGQNFLRSDEMAHRIAKAIPTEHLVLEIGPGDGFLTQELLETGHRVLAVEIDKTWIPKLHSRLKHYRDFKIITGNILELDWKSLSEEADDVVIAGNLPYHLATATLFSVCQFVREQIPPNVHEMIVMVQHEVGLRLSAQPNCKDYSAITLLAKYHADVEYLFRVPARHFMPQPRVDGGIIRFTFKKPSEMSDVDYLQFRRIVRGCFAQRRKMMRNSLNVINEIPEGWRDLDYDFTRRPEHFSFEEFVSLTKDLIDLDTKNNV